MLVSLIYVYFSVTVSVRIPSSFRIGQCSHVARHSPCSVIKGRAWNCSSNSGDTVESCCGEAMVTHWQDKRGVWPAFTRLQSSAEHAGGLQFPWKPETLGACGLVWKSRAAWPANIMALFEMERVRDGVICQWMGPISDRTWVIY